MTNIWAWVRETRERLAKADPPAQRLAQIMRELPSAVTDEAHERVDSLVPEALALAGELEEPWVELFIRHWGLQSRVLHRRQARDELHEAVALLDFANRPRTQACPQGVCAVQDLAACYSIRDGPGYVQERLAVARESLERIDPSWSCFECISAEYFEALMDDGRSTEALAFIEAQAAQLVEHGELELGFNIVSNRARALAQLGRPEQALALLEGIRDVDSQGRSRQTTFRQAKVSVLLALDRVEEALALHPPLAAIRETAGHFRDWVANQAALVERGRIPNTAEVGRELLEVQVRLERNGARWDTATTALTGARLALARGARTMAKLLLDDFDRVRPSLRRPALLEDRRRALGEALANASTTLPEDEDEQALERLGAARSERPEDPELALEYAAALRRVGRSSLARALLEGLARDDRQGQVTVELARVLLAEHDHAALDALLEPFFDSTEREPELNLYLPLAWIRGESLRERGELERAIALDRRILALAPEVTPLRGRLAANARALGDWDTALAELEILAEELEPGDVDWDRITAATVLGRWAIVRAAATRLGMSLPGEDDEPIELDLGLIRCEFVEQDGRRERCWAQRSSPCGAEIIEIALPGDPQHFRDRVVFEPLDLDAHARDEEHHRPCFEVVAILEPGRQRAFLLRGWDPGPERFAVLRERVREAGFGFERITAPGRSAADSRRPEGSQEAQASEVATVALLVALSHSEDPTRLRSLIAEAIADWELPLLDPQLDTATGESEAAARSAELLDRWKP